MRLERVNPSLTGRKRGSHHESALHLRSTNPNSPHPHTLLLFVTEKLSICCCFCKHLCGQRFARRVIVRDAFKSVTPAVNSGK